MAPKRAPWWRARGTGFHWFTGFTGHLPLHRLRVDRLISQLPDDDALSALVAETGVRWILLRPIEQWPSAIADVRAGLLAMPRLRLVASRSGWDLLAVGSRAENPAAVDGAQTPDHPHRAYEGQSVGMR